MTHEIYETAGRTRHLIGTAETYEAAEAKARDHFNIAFLDQDEDHPGCADFLTSDGRLGIIQPAGFTL